MQPSLPTPRAALIDLDDTIIDDSTQVERCWREARSLAAGHLSEGGERALREAIEGRRQWYWADAVRHREGRLALRKASTLIVDLALRDLGFDLPDLASAIANRYRDLREETACLIPGALEALDRLRSRGVRLALITNGEAQGQRGKVERFGLGAYFDHLQIEGEFGLGKPHPEVYAAALRALGAGPAEAWSVGDNLEWDVLAPQKQGMFGIWLDRNGRGLPVAADGSPDLILRALSELS